ncbi:LLM class flavin-dependent oxidoreductase [Bradyrhizobium sp. STM 3561]|uniref:LLM class flavin-dependent oxidoreductase n=1 Tax=Bradyrhizobium sp. STM 3561 TaxID=578923 RepID=UPI00388F47ED
MSIELLMLGDQPVSRLAARTRLAEESGFETVWLADERFYRETYSCLSYLAGQTSRVKLGPCVTDPFARHPALTAMALGTLDEISEGRAILGIGAGVSGFAELGIQSRKPPLAIREAVDLIRQLMAGQEVDYRGEIIQFHRGRLNFTPPRARVPVRVASNGPLGQKMGGAVAEGVMMEGCGSVEEAQAFASAVAEGATKAGRSPGEIKLIARLDCCIADDGKQARDILRPSVTRIIAQATSRFYTLQTQGLTLPKEVVEAIGPVPYAAGVAPFAALFPLVTDRHVDALTLCGTVEEVTQHVIDLRRAGVTGFNIFPVPAPGVSYEDVIMRFGTQVWPAVEAAFAKASSDRQT